MIPRPPERLTQPSHYVLVGYCTDLHTSVIFPVSHGLLEERLVHPAEVGVDLVGDHCVVPDPLHPRSRRSPESQEDSFSLILTFQFQALQMFICPFVPKNFLVITCSAAS